MKTSGVKVPPGFGRWHLAVANDPNSIRQQEKLTRGYSGEGGRWVNDGYGSTLFGVKITTRGTSCLALGSDIPRYDEGLEESAPA